MKTADQVLPGKPLSGGLPPEGAAWNSGLQIDAAAAALYLPCKLSSLFRFISLFACSFSRSYAVHLFIRSCFEEFLDSLECHLRGDEQPLTQLEDEEKINQTVLGHCWKYCASKWCMPAGADCQQGRGLVTQRLLLLFSIPSFIYLFFLNRSVNEDHSGLRKSFADARKMIIKH